MGKTKLIFALIFLSLGIQSCKKKPTQPDPIELVQGDVYITNEGNFMFGNASVSLYRPSDGSVVSDLYFAQNAQALGDVCQSLYIKGNSIFVVVNNSGKVVEVDANSFVRKRTISNLVSPRYFLPLSDEKAYCTDLYQNGISIINLTTGSKSGVISCNGWTENLEFVNGKVFVANKTKGKLYVISPATDQIVDSLTLRSDPNSMSVDKNGTLWVLCGGSSSNSEAAALFKINATTLAKEEYVFENIRPSKLTMNGTKDTLFFATQSLFRMGINETQVPSSAFLSPTVNNLYAFSVHPNTYEIYISDAMDFVQRGRITRFKPSGEQIDSFLAGIIPGGIYFRTE